MNAKTDFSQLKSSLWKAANTLRGSAVDRTDWKGYILPLLFYKRLSDVYREACTALAGHTSSEKGLVTNIETYTKEEEKRKEAEKLRNTIQTIRGLFHPDKVPKLALQKILYCLNSFLEEYLGIFTLPFTAHLTEEFELRATIDDGSNEIAAKSLSVGQRVVLSLCFRFAISDMIGGKLNLMIIDEPCAALDSENQDKFVELLDRIKSIADAGSTIVLATHTEGVKDACSRLVDLTD